MEAVPGNPFLCGKWRSPFLLPCRITQQSLEFVWISLRIDPRDPIVPNFEGENRFEYPKTRRLPLRYHQTRARTDLFEIQFEVAWHEGFGGAQSCKKGSNVFF